MILNQKVIPANQAKTWGIALRVIKLDHEIKAAFYYRRNFVLVHVTYDKPVNSIILMGNFVKNLL